MSDTSMSEDRVDIAEWPSEQSSLLAMNVRGALLGLQNGQITITVHDGQIIQIDRLLRKRQFRSRPRQR